MLRKPSSTRPPRSPESNLIRVVELIVDAIKVLAWPSLVLYGAIVFFSPLNQIVSGLATKINDANKVSIGGFSVEVEAKVRESTSPELAKSVGALSPAAIEQLMRTDRGGGITLLSSMRDEKDAKLGLPKEPRLDALRELSAKGFIAFYQPLDSFLRELRKSPKDTSLVPGSEYDWFLIQQGAASVEYRRLREQGYRLTDQGGVASDAIVKAVSELISRKAA